MGSQAVDSQCKQWRRWFKNTAGYKHQQLGVERRNELGTQIKEQEGASAAQESQGLHHPPRPPHLLPADTNQEKSATHSPLPPTCQQPSAHSQERPSVPLPRPSAPVQSGGSRAEKQSEYGQYSRKNYLKRDKERDNSDLTDKIANRNQSLLNEQKEKSKSALEYAKYFIKQVSYPPTDNSERGQNQPSCDENSHPNLPRHSQRPHSSSRQIAREHSRESHRNSIMDKLRSLKSYRSKSRSNQGSVKGQRQPSIEKSSEKLIQGLKENNKKSSSQNMIDRIKTRHRNRNVLLKVRLINQSAPEVLDESMSLMLNSIVDRSQSERTETAEKIELYMEILNLLPSYVKQFKEIYEDVQCWDELIFLTYKKFYLQRLKVIQSLSNMVPYYSPFRLPFSQVSAAELRGFNPSILGLRMEEKVREQNRQIENALREIYNHIIEKSGREINLLEEDDFSEEIYFLMGEEVRLLGEEQQAVNSVGRRRMAMTIKCCYLIAYLNGEKVDIDSVLTDAQLTNGHLSAFQSFLNSML